jgi:hypothetical protein
MAVTKAEFQELQTQVVVAAVELLPLVQVVQV